MMKPRKTTTSKLKSSINLLSLKTTPSVVVLKLLLLLILQAHVYVHNISSITATLTVLSTLSFGVNAAEFLHTERPYFDDSSPRNVTAVADETAVLKCRVKNKGNRTVSWMRKRDLHILTTNIYTYTGDQRFSVLHPMGSDDWDLKIDYAQQRDSGIYECQVNTEPKINLAVLLEITAARAKILGSTEIHVKRDSTIALACSVNIHASSVSWYHGASIVDFDSLRGGISLETEKTDYGTTSRLMLTRANLRDSGNYTCMPNGAIPASVRVHVLTGEQPAAMQTSSAMGSKSRKMANNKSLCRHLFVLFGIYVMIEMQYRQRCILLITINKNLNDDNTFISQTASILNKKKLSQQEEQLTFDNR